MMHDTSITPLTSWRKHAARLLWPFLGSLRDLLPIVIVMMLFQTLVVRQPVEHVLQMGVGLVFVVIGLTLFVFGLELGLFPLGERLATDFARKGSLLWLLAFAFALGFGTTFAEPALIAVAGKAAHMAVLDAPPDQLVTLQQQYAIVLRVTVAISVGAALMLGALRIIMGWRLHYLILVGYLIVVIMTPFAPPSIIAVAYDSGGVTTSTITVPLTAALGVGLASSIKGRNPLFDGFGLIAIASVMPIIFVLILGIVRG